MSNETQSTAETAGPHRSPLAVDGLYILVLLPSFVLLLSFVARMLVGEPGPTETETAWHEALASTPMMMVGYFFGALGGVTRTISETGRFFTGKGERNRIAATFVSGVLGMMTYFALESGFVLQLIYPEFQHIESSELSFRGLAIAAFLVGFFSGEAVRYGRAKLEADQTRHQGEGTK